MTAAAVNGIFERLSSTLADELGVSGYEVVSSPSDADGQELHEGQTGGYLVANVPFNKAGDRVLMEMGVFELFGRALLRFDTTIFANITDDGVDSLTEVLEELNLLCPFGHFGIFDGDLYHRYSVILPEFSASECDKICESVLLVIDTIRKLLAINLSSLEDALEDDDEYLRLMRAEDAGKGTVKGRKKKTETKK